MKKIMAHVVLKVLGGGVDEVSMGAQAQHASTTR